MGQSNCSCHRYADPAHRWFRSGAEAEPCRPAGPVRTLAVAALGSGAPQGGSGALHRAAGRKAVLRSRCDEDIQVPGAAEPTTPFGTASATAQSLIAQSLIAQRPIALSSG